MNQESIRIARRARQTEDNVVGLARQADGIVSDLRSVDKRLASAETNVADHEQDIGQIVAAFGPHLFDDALAAQLRLISQERERISSLTTDYCNHLIEHAATDQTRLPTLTTRYASNPMRRMMRSWS